MFVPADCHKINSTIRISKKKSVFSQIFITGFTKTGIPVARDKGAVQSHQLSSTGHFTRYWEMGSYN
jgi:hypothetical protein